METEFLNFHDEGHFSDFSLSLEQVTNLSFFITVIQFYVLLLMLF